MCFLYLIFPPDPDFKNDPAGCTAIVAIYTEDNRLFVANAGDSRAVISSRGKAHALSFDHKPTLDGLKLFLSRHTSTDD